MVMSLEMEMLVLAWDNYKKNSGKDQWTSEFEQMENAVLQLVALEESYHP